MLMLSREVITSNKTILSSSHDLLAVFPKDNTMVVDRSDTLVDQLQFTKIININMFSSYSIETIASTNLYIFCLP